MTTNLCHTMNLLCRFIKLVLTCKSCDDVFTDEIDVQVVTVCLYLLLLSKLICRFFVILKEPSCLWDVLSTVSAMPSLEDSLYGEEYRLLCT